jgi:hypothetical protein
MAEDPLLFWDAFDWTPIPAVAIEAVGAKHCNVQHVPGEALDQCPFVEGGNIMNHVPSNLSRPLQGKTLQLRQRCPFM